jgi:hypothetical protein
MDSNLLRIGRSNLENLNSEIRDANLKKNRLPILFICIAEIHNSAKVWVAYTYIIFDRNIVDG